MLPIEKEEKSDYEMLQEKRKAEQKELLDGLKQASSALSKTPKVSKPAKVLGPRQLDALPLRSSARKEQRPADVKPKTPREIVRSRRTSTGSISSESNVSENLESQSSNQTISSGWTNTDEDQSATETTCHHCREKSTYTKTVCGSGNCQGLRGQFCADCLKDHYGEDLEEVLRDPTWQCPPCRNACKCSRCRKRGSAILTELAVGRGYKSVRDYLESLIQKLE